MTYILLLKLQHYDRVYDLALNLIKSYLEDRKQFVQFDESNSEMKFIHKGVPQGSIIAGAPNSTKFRGGCRVSATIRQRGGGCNNFYFSRFKNITFKSFYAKQLKRPTFKNFTLLKGTLFRISS